MYPSETVEVCSKLRYTGNLDIQIGMNITSNTTIQQGRPRRRAEKVCTDETKVRELQYLRRTFRANGYPSNIITCALGQQTTTEDSVVHTTKETLKTLYLPYVSVWIHPEGLWQYPPTAVVQSDNALLYYMYVLAILIKLVHVVKWHCDEVANHIISLIYCHFLSIYIVISFH